QRIAGLQQLDRDQVWRAHEGHVAVARRPVDGHAHRLQVRALRVDVVHPEREVAEVAGTAVVLVRTPVPGQLDLRIRAVRCRQEHEREAPLFVVLASHLAQAEAFAIEAQGRVEVADADHGVQVAHGGRGTQSRNRSGSSGFEGSTAYCEKSVTPASRSTSSSSRKLPLKPCAGRDRIACAASATISGLRQLAVSTPGSMLTASVAITVHGHSAFTATPRRPTSAASPMVTKLIPIFARV